MVKQNIRATYLVRCVYSIEVVNLETRIGSLATIGGSRKPIYPTLFEFNRTSVQRLTSKFVRQ